MFAASMFHALNDGFTVSSSGVAVALVSPKQRQAGAQGLFGGVQTLVGGLAALLAGRLYQDYGRATAYATCAVVMVALVVIGLAGAWVLWVVFAWMFFGRHGGRRGRGGYSRAHARALHRT